MGESNTILDQVERRVGELWAWLQRSGNEVGESKSVVDLLSRVSGRLRSLYNYAFRRRNVIFFGPKGSGKTSLKEYLESGRAVVVTHEPTAGVALVDRNYELGSTDWLRVAHDPGGDALYRTLWPKLTKTINPDAIVYVLDGRKSVEEVECDMEVCLQQSLSEYAEGRLRLIYVFVNFYDVWCTDPFKNDVLCSAIQHVAAKKKHTYPALRALRLKAEPTHINPHLHSWPELETALSHFATDLKSLPLSYEHEHVAAANAVSSK